MGGTNPFDQEGSDSAYNNLLERIATQKNEKELDLSLCNLASVPLEAIQTFHKNGPTSLILSHNWISFIPPRFTVDMASITKLDLSRNWIKELPDNFGNLKGLTFLDLHRNLLKTLPLSMGGLSQLQYLNLADNPLRDPLMGFLKMGAVRNETDNYKINVSHPIIQFLQEVALEATKDAGGNVQMSRKRSVTFAPESEDTYDDENRNFEPAHIFGTRQSAKWENQHRTSRSTGRMQSARPSRGTSRTEVVSPRTASQPEEKPSTVSSLMWGSIYFMLVIIMTPFVAALIVDPAYVENLANDSGPLLTSVLDFYLLFHSFATEAYTYFGIDPPFLIKGPAPPPYTGFFFTTLDYIRRGFSTIVDYVWRK